MKPYLANNYEGIDYDLAKIVQRILLIFPLPALALSVTLFYLGDQLRGVIMLIAILFMLLMVFLLNRGWLRLTVVTFSVTMNLFVTWSCIHGNGIHDVAVVIYPVIILFSAIILRKGDLLFVSVLSGVCIAVVVLGEMYGYYVAADTGGSDGADVLIISFLLICGFVTTSTLSKKINLSLASARDEISHQEEMKEILSKNLESKSDMLREVHHRVKNHLAFINSVLDIQAMENPEIADKKSDLQNRVLAVARVHDQLYHSDKYKEVEIKDYLEKIIGTFVSTNNLFELKVEMQIEESVLDTFKALNLALLVNELLVTAEKRKSTIRKMEFILSVTDKHFCFIVDKKSQAKWDLDAKSMASINLLVDKFDGQFEFLDGQDKSIFEVNF